MGNKTINQCKRMQETWTAAVALAGTILTAAPAHALDLDVYGVGHLSADQVDDGTDSEQHIASNSSRLGFRGGHDLDNDLRVMFQYEAGVDLTGQGGNDGNGAPAGSTSDIFTAARDSYVGLSGDFGTVKAGKLPGLNLWVYDYNLFADQVGDLGNIWGGTGLPGRVTSAVQYRTPDFSGLSGSLSYVPDEDATRSTDIYLVKADYLRTGLKLGAALANLDQVSGDEWQVYALTGSYDFDRFTVGGGWQSESDIGGTAGNDRDSFMVGASMAVGSKGKLKAHYADSDADASGRDAGMWAFGYDHAVNKYTTVYAAYAATDNDSAATFTANNWGKGDAVAPAAGQDPAAFSVGVIVNFGANLLPR